MIFHELSSLDGNKSWSLFVDTSTHYGQLMAYNNDEVIFDRTWGHDSKHDRVLNLFFNELMEHLDLSDLKHIVCVYGPGSFTGLKVSATFAKILSLSLGGLPIYGLSSFHLYAFKILEDKKKINPSSSSSNKNFNENLDGTNRSSNESFNENLNKNLNESFNENLNESFNIFIPSIGSKTFKSSFTFCKTLKSYQETIDLSGSKEHNPLQPNEFMISDIQTDSLYDIRHQSLKKNSILKPHIQKFSYLDFYPLFLRQSEAEERTREKS